MFFFSLHQNAGLNIQQMPQEKIPFEEVSTVNGQPTESQIESIKSSKFVMQSRLTKNVTSNEFIAENG